MEEGVDTVGDGVLLLFRGQDVFRNLGWRRMLTQLVTGCCCCLENMTLWKSRVEEGVDTVGNGVLLLFGGINYFGNLVWRRVLTQLVMGCCCCLEDQTFVVILGGGGC